MAENLLTVSQLNEYLRAAMDRDPLLSSIYILGEISNFTNHYKTGHFYFSLKDETGNLRAVMFRTYASRVAFLPENGMRVIAHGRVSVFPRDGQYQIYVDDMQPDGVGAMYLAYEQIRKKLAAEGLFDPARKRPIPKFPESIGIVTSPTGAAVRDMLQIIGRRYPAARVILYPALVQGAGAPESLCAGIRYFNEQCRTDVLIVGRGGGSAEDLWAFNNETLARCVAESLIPVISAVGHETDTTICDFAADLRAPTPSAAAELATPDRAELQRYLADTARGMTARLRQRIGLASERLRALASSNVLATPRAYLDERSMQVARLGERLAQAQELSLLRHKGRFEALCGKLEALSPLHALSRGYAAVYSGTGKLPYTKAADLAAGEDIRIRFSDGVALATVIGLEESE